ncbi:uracil-DNA glycosylase [Myxococcota bacterium]|nr:uracil-DNA glycosylase [Myxococcota bacterium]MBU1383009.1 uracil-DNA glycosylase [Myxococcota bacterium]MBU1498836.1 uracil-DNA glycosylase [Myxococcota bacterium]
MPEMPPWLDDGEIPDMPDFPGDFDDDFLPEESGPVIQKIKSENLGSIENLDDLRSVWGDCKRCGLSQTRKNLVFGEGNQSASVLFIGEGPGADEDRQGRPFVGKSGELLTRMIEAMGLTRNDVFIANIVKCRPPGNRDPEPGEILTCIPVLRRQIEIIKPKLIVCLGRVSAQSLLSTKDSITRLRGSFHKYEGIDLLVTFHPAYLLRSPEKKRDAWADLQLVMERIGLKNG